MVLPLGRCHGPSGSNNSFSVLRSPSLSAAKARLTTALLASAVDSRAVDWARAAAAKRTARLTQGSFRIELCIGDFLQHGARMPLTRSRQNLKGGRYWEDTRQRTCVRLG